MAKVNVTMTVRTKFYWYTKPVMVASYLYWRLFGKGEKFSYPKWAFKVEVV